MSASQSPPAFQVQETYIQKGLRKCREQPIVPIGVVLTCAAFLGATRSMRSGDRASFNRFLRFRVLAQGITVVGCVAGAWWLGREARLGKMQQETEDARTGRRPLREGKFDGGLDGRIKEAERLSAVERASDQAQKTAPPAVEPGKAEQKRNDEIQPIKVSTLLGARVEKRPPPPADGPSAAKT